MNAAQDRAATPSPTGETLRVVHHLQDVPSPRIHAMVQSAAGIPNLAFDSELTPSGECTGSSSKRPRTSNVRVAPNGAAHSGSVDAQRLRHRIERVLPVQLRHQARPAEHVLQLHLGPARPHRGRLPQHDGDRDPPWHRDRVQRLRRPCCEGEPACPHKSAGQPAESGPHACARTLSAEQRAVALRSVVSRVVGGLALMRRLTRGTRRGQSGLQPGIVTVTDDAAAPSGMTSTSSSTGLASDCALGSWRRFCLSTPPPSTCSTGSRTTHPSSPPMANRTAYNKARADRSHPARTLNHRAGRRPSLGQDRGPQHDH